MGFRMICSPITKLPTVFKTLDSKGDAVRRCGEYPYYCCSAGTVPRSVLSNAGTLRSISERIGRMNENR
jgi:hypothetical protein